MTQMRLLSIFNVEFQRPFPFSLQLLLYNGRLAVSHRDAECVILAAALMFVDNQIPCIVTSSVYTWNTYSLRFVG